MAERKKVLVLGGGVAALAAAAALVEHNTDKAGETGPRFDITVMTSDDVWGGRASSWAGGDVRHRYEQAQGHLSDWDFRHWPPDVPLNHGFHAVFDQSTYVNFWYTLKLAGLSPDGLKGSVLISNEHEILVHESQTHRVCRLQVHDPAKYPFPFNSHLTDSAWELFRRGGWTPRGIYSFGIKVMENVFGYSTFDELAELDIHQQISFQKWCHDRGVSESIFSKMMFKFLFQGTYIAPNTMDATSALMGLWVILRGYDAAQWFYINGGITRELMNPIAEFLKTHSVTLLMKHDLTSLRTESHFAEIVGYTTRNLEGGTEDIDSLGPFDYYISTLPLDSAVKMFKRSGPTISSPFTLLHGFPDVATLERDKRFPDTAGTVNLQAWFQEPGLLSDDDTPRGDYRNVIAGLEPLCVIVDYKNILPMYKGDARFPGSVLEINGSLQELESPENYGYFECDTRFGAPGEARTIQFAKAIMIDIAKRYNFKKLQCAVEREAFADWPDQWQDRSYWPGRGNRIPPFLWKNTDPYNRFFVTGPGTLQYRPWIWRSRYPSEHLELRPKGLPEPAGYPRNLFFAGDWTRNGFDIPSMEGAARSGRMAALAVIKSALGCDATADPREPEETTGKSAFIQIYDPQ